MKTLAMLMCLVPAIASAEPFVAQTYPIKVMGAAGTVCAKPPNAIRYCGFATVQLDPGAPIIGEPALTGCYDRPAPLLDQHVSLKVISHAPLVVVIGDTLEGRVQYYCIAVTVDAP